MSATKKVPQDQPRLWPVPFFLLAITLNMFSAFALFSQDAGILDSLIVSLPLTWLVYALLKKRGLAWRWTRLEVLVAAFCVASILSALFQYEVIATGGL
jgi:hypothetical protein